MGSSLFKGPICKKSWFLSWDFARLVKYWHSGMVGQYGRHPNASVFDKLAKRLKNQLFIQIGPLINCFSGTPAGPQTPALRWLQWTLPSIRHFNYIFQSFSLLRIRYLSLKNTNSHRTALLSFIYLCRKHKTALKYPFNSIRFIIIMQSVTVKINCDH